MLHLVPLILCWVLNLHCEVRTKLRRHFLQPYFIMSLLKDVFVCLPTISKFKVNKSKLNT